MNLQLTNHVDIRIILCGIIIICTHFIPTYVQKERYIVCMLFNALLCMCDYDIKSVAELIPYTREDNETSAGDFSYCVFISME